MMIYEGGWNEKGHDHDGFETINVIRGFEIEVSIIAMIYDGVWNENGHDYDDLWGGLVALLYVHLSLIVCA